MSPSSISIDQGESGTLSWSSKYADSVILSPGNTTLEAEGTIELSPAQSTTYILTAVNPYGNDTGKLHLEVSRNSSAPLEPSITSAYAFGRSVTLSWTSSHDDYTAQDRWA